MRHSTAGLDPQASGSGIPPVRPLDVVLLASILLLALLLRLPALAHDLWIDEVWTLGIARDATSWRDALWHESSNNHILNTLVFLIIGPAAPDWAYRVHALVAGLAAIVLAWRMGWRTSRSAAVLSAVLFAGSFLLCAYSVEGRGYSMLVLFSLAAWMSTRWWLETGTPWALATVWSTVVLGSLSQFLFVETYAALAIVVTFELLVVSSDRRTAWKQWVLFHSLPLPFFIALYVLVVRHLVNGGTPPWTWAETLTDTVRFGFGLPGLPICVGIAALLLLVGLGFDAYCAPRIESIFFISIVAVVPAVTVALLRNEYVVPRYFLVNFAFFLIAAARVLGRGIGRGGSVRAVSVLLVLGFLALGIRDTLHFAALGRGRYREVVEHMAASTKTPVIRVTGNHDFNVWALLDHHARYLPSNRQISYYAHEKLPPDGVDWVIVDRPKFPAPPEPSLTIGSWTFDLELYRPSFGPLGAEWALYRRR